MTTTPAAATAAPATTPVTAQSVIIGADHGGFALKQALVAHLKGRGIPVEDIGTHAPDSVDYPDYAHRVAGAVAAGRFPYGILCCTSGIGMSIAANRHAGVQASVVYDVDDAIQTRQHNDSNVLCLSGKKTGTDTAIAIVDAWLATDFEGGRHERRVKKANDTHACATGIDHVGPQLIATDPEIARAIAAEEERQAGNIELIASENFASRAIQQAQGSCLTNKYAEGYPGKRWYGGCENVDQVEQLAIDRACQLFGAKFANVQPHSGSQANAAVYFSVLEPGDKILTMDLSHGGHLTHGHPANFSGKFYEVRHYGVSEDAGVIDYDQLAAAALEFQPKMITAGASAYSRIIDFARMRQIADSVGAWLFVDMAHIAGLVAAGVHPSPVPHAHFVTTTTHKSLRGPRGGLILTNDEELAKKINATVFPGVQGGPLMHVIAAKAVCFHEALQPGYREYQDQIVKNARALSGRLTELGYRILSGGTDNHVFMVDVRPQGLNGKLVQETLDEAGITVNKNSIPYDTESPFKGGGIRIGTPAATTRGMKEDDMRLVADLIHEAITHRKDESRLHAIRDRVRELNARFPLP
ncbi:MAG: ribose 5-phosphate isomerase B [Verrucomicrobiales bacterium]|nr:ribose 5-phosphate isomerase B [Verrucomicrobiales bacterium]